jgi:hypothetical protein
VEAGRDENSASKAAFVPQCCRMRDSRTAIMTLLTLRKSREEMHSTIRGRPED